MCKNVCPPRTGWTGPTADESPKPEVPVVFQLVCGAALLPSSFSPQDFSFIDSPSPGDVVPGDSADGGSSFSSSEASAPSTAPIGDRPPDRSSPDEESLSPLDASVRFIWGVKYAGAWAVLLFAVFFYDLTHLFGASWLPFGVLSGSVLAVGLLHCMSWPQLRYRRWGFALRPEELYLEHGVITNVRTIVPLRRIQHLDVSQDLLEREFGLGRLVVHTAGSRSSDVVIPGLPLEEAERIRDEVKRFILEDPLTEDPV